MPGLARYPLLVVDEVLKGDSYCINNRDLGRVPTSRPTTNEPKLVSFRLPLTESGSHSAASICRISSERPVSRQAKFTTVA